MVDVFISYSRGNQDAVRQLAEAVKRLGYVVWWDDELPPHLSYGDVITEKIGAAKAAIVVWSAGSIGSEWVRAEADLARNQKKLIQTALDNCMPPMPFNQIQFASIGDWNGASDHPGWRKVKASLTALCGPPPGESGTSLSEPPAPPPPPEAPPAPTSLSEPTAPPVVAPPLHEPTQRTQPVIVFAPAPRKSNTVLVAAIAASVAVILVIGGITLFRNRAPAGTVPANAVAAAAAAPGNAQTGAANASGEGREERQDGSEAADGRSAADTGRDPSETLPGSDSRRLTEDDIEGLSVAQLRLARNEIYARHGRTFADPALSAHFSRYSWYEPTSDEVALSPVEQANVEFLSAAENR
ncbi:MAG TPA: YARHG domain-containing protein [Allosphingosinicella sp.]|nr:YARHG domain-containing protein [Allosphingosinicella sp.]